MKVYPDFSDNACYVTDEEAAVKLCNFLIREGFAFAFSGISRGLTERRFCFTGIDAKVIKALTKSTVRDGVRNLLTKIQNEGDMHSNHLATMALSMIERAQSF